MKAPVTVAGMTDGSCRRLERCRVCSGSRLVKFLDLGRMPLVNRYLAQPGADEPRFPLEILFCEDCSLSQLSVVVSPRILYSDYPYQSSVSVTFQEHCAAMAATLGAALRLSSNDLVLEIASNDGCLLSRFKSVGCRVLGVEPAENLARMAERAGLPTLNRFWDADAAREVVGRFGRPKLIVATNVVAHVDDLIGFLSSVRESLAPGGTFVFEVPYMVHFMNRAEFDTTYHEHLSYFLLRPLARALDAAGLRLTDANEHEIHGGSIRVFARRASEDCVPSESAKRLLAWEEELGLHESTTYLKFASHVSILRDELTVFLSALRAKGKRIAAYGASAKGNVLLNYCSLGPGLIEFVVDDTPSKQGKYYPGNHLQIVGREHLWSNRPDYLLLLAWNFVDELVRNTADFRAGGGRYIVPIPSLRIM